MPTRRFAMCGHGTGLQTAHERLRKLQQQLSGAKKQMDDPVEVAELEKQITQAEAELAKLKGE